MRCVRHDTARPRDNWPVSPHVCLRSMWLCLLSIAYLPAATHAQPHMRKPLERRRGERRDAGVTRHTAGASRASAHVPAQARGAPRPAAPRVARLTPCDSVARVSVSIRARSPPGAAVAPRAAQRSMKPGAVLKVAIDRGKQLATRALEPRRAPPIELPPAAKTSCAFAPPLGRAIFFTTATPAAQACATRRAVSPILPAEKPRVGKASAALPRDGREPRRRETGDHLPCRRRPCVCAGGAVVTMPSIAARAVPPTGAARLAAWCGLAG